MLVKSCRLIADKHVVFYITIMMIYFSILHPDCYWTRPEKMPRIQWMGCAVIYREILYLSGFTYKGNNHWKLQVNNISGGWGDLTRGLGGGGVSSRLVFFFESRNTFGEGLCYELKPGHIAYKKIYHD